MRVEQRPQQQVGQEERGDTGRGGEREGVSTGQLASYLTPSRPSSPREVAVLHDGVESDVERMLHLLSFCLSCSYYSPGSLGRGKDTGNLV